MPTYKFEVKKGFEKKDGTANIKLRLTQHRKQRYISTPFFIAPKYFENETGKVNKKYPTHIKFNSELTKYLLDFETRLLSIDNFENKSIEDLIRELKKENKSKILLSNYVDRILPKIKEGSERNADIYTDTLRIILKFRQNIYIQDIDRGFLLDFESHLKAKGNKINTIGIYMRTLRSIINKAINDEILEQNNYPFRKFKIKKECTPPRHLLHTEVQKLIKYKPINKSEQQAKDIFLFMICSIGINIKDLFFLKKANNINYRRSKQKGLFVIKMHPVAKEIIKKYADDDFMFDFAKRYKQYDSLTSATNNNLKVIANKIGINPKISTYYSRHTWAYIALNECYINKEVIAWALGHSRTSTTDIYARVEQNRVDEANFKVIDFLFN